MGQETLEPRRDRPVCMPISITGSYLYGQVISDPQASSLAGNEQKGACFPSPMHRAALPARKDTQGFLLHPFQFLGITTYPKGNPTLQSSCPLCAGLCLGFSVHSASVTGCLVPH